ncbi:phage shock protein operon transcriptional activator [Desulfovibrio mangrovi]|uniref:phage shock protein operon transcriptional activator n=1 Tax=Desulfovibrio mangrovi TaxID=2976983 RepID=UPI0022452656|nr:phage shock protein operon transcriptional activator [Desulfovibrio mangrovi]UZP66144.1 phage shock protein operon transcriptional activator [Desulfovibrio mangrovi]
MTTRNTSPALTEALGSSDAFLSFQEDLSRAAAVERPILIIGERGTGKELAAARLHYLSSRWQKPMITVNCASLTESLLESELFGHEAGAFTGAAGRRTGRFEQADGGTLFLDEIGAMPLRMQEAILRVVEYGTMQRVGGSRPLQVDVRIIAATNADLPAMAAKGTFKPDLLDRLSFEVLTLPPLRERGEDILLLAERFAASMIVEMGLPGLPELSDAFIAALYRHPWPGNVRELKNTVERAVFRQGTQLGELPLSPFASPYTPHVPHPTTAAEPCREISDATATMQAATDQPPDLSRPLQSVLEEIEMRYLAEALQRAKHNQRHAAALMGLRYHQFRGLYRKHKQAIEGT